MTEGRVDLWNAEEGWGVIVSAETPSGCWFHFSNLWSSEMPKLRAGQQASISPPRNPVLGETVDYEWIADEGDGYQFFATDVRPRRPGSAVEVASE